MTAAIGTRSSVLNTHHLLKLVALLLMTVDHFGAYLFPDLLWLRLFGRFSAPIWFFLAGHALSYPIKRDLILWGTVMAVLNPFLGLPLFPLNTLVTIFLSQQCIRYAEKRQWFADNPLTFCLGALVLFVPTQYFFEYGTAGFLYTLLGYAVRSKQMSWRTGKLIAIAALALFMLEQLLVFDFTMPETLLLSIGVVAITYGLTQFQHRPVILGQRYAWVEHGLRYLSRISLQYYVIHRLALQALALALGATDGMVYPELRWF